jgi:hypothetical protein
MMVISERQKPPPPPHIKNPSNIPLVFEMPLHALSVDEALFLIS